jgi:hypothetical protein
MFEQFRWALSRFRSGELPLACLLAKDVIEKLAHELGYKSYCPVYTSVTTILTFLSQVLSSDHSCQEAVDGLVAHRVACGQSRCSNDTGVYCRARQRLPEELPWELMRRTGRELEDEAPSDWRWLGRRVRVVDGSTLRIADTPKNRQEYPLQKGIKTGTSYPVVRVLTVFSLAVGTVVDAAMRPYKGKGTGETGMLRDLADCFCPGDVILGDRYFAGYFDIAWWLERGVDLVTRLPKSRRADFRRGERLGRDDHIVHWRTTDRPDWIDLTSWHEFPDTLRLREVRVRVRQPGFRTKEVIVVTTLLDPVAYPKEALASLFRRRWSAELNLRSLKTHMQMEQLRCKTPAMVRKEFAMHLLGYNCIKRTAAIAAEYDGRQPWEVSFKGTMQSINEFTRRLPKCSSRDDWLEGLIYPTLAVRVGNRPDRIEPYATKTRPKDYPFLKESRQRYKNRYRKAA